MVVLRSVQQVYIAHETKNENKTFFKRMIIGHVIKFPLYIVALLHDLGSSHAWIWHN